LTSVVNHADFSSNDSNEYLFVRANISQLSLNSLVILDKIVLLKKNL